MAAPTFAQDKPVVQVGAPLPDGVAAAPPIIPPPPPPPIPGPPPPAGHPTAGPTVPYAPAYAQPPAVPATPVALPVKRQCVASLEYLLFKLRPNPTPPLVQSLPVSLGIPSGDGSLPPGATSDVFAGDGTDPNPFNGIRGTVGWWLDPKGCYGVDASFTYLFEESDDFHIRSDGIPVLGRAFVDVGASVDAFLYYSIANGRQRSQISIESPTKMYTADLNFRRRGMAVLSDRLEWFVGARYFNLDDAVIVDSAVTVFDENLQPAVTISSHEGFRARNQFFGAQVGTTARYDWGCWRFDVTGKLAFGGVAQKVTIDGGSVSQEPGEAPLIFPSQSILLVQPSNAGTYDRGRFAVLSEVNVRLGYQITPNLTATVGYDALSLSSVQRSGGAIDRGVNPANTRYISVRQESDAGRPGFTFSGTDFWAQGLTLGLALSY